MYGNMAERSKALESGRTMFLLIQSERAWVRIPLLSTFSFTKSCNRICLRGYSTVVDIS